MYTYRNIGRKIVLDMFTSIVLGIREASDSAAIVLGTCQHDMGNPRGPRSTDSRTTFVSRPEPADNLRLEGWRV